MKIYMIRHGVTDWNVAKRMQGSTDIPLNEDGREVARKTSIGLKDVHFDRVYSSPLCRAYETAQIILGDRDLPIQKDDRLREISFGDYEGMVIRGPEATLPDPSFLNFFEAPELYVPPKGGETFASLFARTSDFLKDFAAESNNDDTVLVAAHGGVLKALLYDIKGQPLSEFWGQGVHRNCETSIIEVADHKITILDEGCIFY